MITTTEVILLIILICESLQQPPDSPVSIIAQTLGREEAGNATETVVPSGTAEKYHNATDPSFLYIVQLELKSSRVEEPYAEFEKRLDKLVEMAFALAAYKHRKQTPPAEITTSNSGYKTKIIRIRTSGDLTYIHFVTYAANEPILGEIVADDMTLLTMSQMSATLRYPLSKIISDRDIENQSTTKLWFLIGILGTGIILIVIGWLCLFFFFNVCGFVYGSKAAAYMARDDEVKKTNVLKLPSPTVSRTKLAAEKPVHTLPFDGSNTVMTLEKPVLNKKDEPGWTPAQLKLLKEMNAEHKKITKAPYLPHPEKERNKARWEAEQKQKSELSVENGVSDTDVKLGGPSKSEKRRRHSTKVGPITTTTANEKEASEISRVGSVSPTTSTQYMDEFDVSNLPETTLKIVKKRKKNNEHDSDVTSEPESDYGSSLDGEKSKDDEDVEQGIHEEHRARPMTAKKHRTSLFGGSGMDALPAQPRAWTVYYAGDRVAEFWNNQRINSHPTPGTPTEDGIIQMMCKNNFRYE
ncbi:hypothetical protein L3Y34_012293 [Caenorhabditis briggsae]|uniref:Uncharacterized protein n=1 Tax=Caenorhabditis briggsae TaxID=6238 RepID=A0AAE8ZTP3_CAEBR|nr:hypothetical protein L3Y34_012293 [Caenorhabditis briggsae]